MTAGFDVAVVGLGAAGSATLQSLARRRVRAIGLDLHHPPHDLGSTHGRSRIIREAYYESPAYVPLVQRAYEEWQRISRDSGRELLVQTGGLMLGPGGGELVTGARQSAEMHGLRHELLEPKELRRRFPAFQVPEGTIGVLEPRAGFVDPEEAVSACLQLAGRLGAEIRLGCRVDGWESTPAGVRLRTSQGEIEAARVVLAVGPWLPRLVQTAPVTIERQVMYWFDAGPGFASPGFPVFIWEWDAGRFFYGIPDHGAGLKVARHHEGQVADPDRVERAVQAEEIRGMRDLLRQYLPAADRPPSSTAVCLYTNTPDHHFLIGPLADEPRILVASACSGHGFKFASALGEVLADLSQGLDPGFDLGLFAADRFPAG